MMSGFGSGNGVISQLHFPLCWCSSQVPRKLLHLIQSGSQQKVGGCLTLGKLEDSRTGRRITTGRLQSLRERNSSVQSSPRPKGEGRAAPRTQMGRPA